MKQEAECWLLPEDEYAKLLERGHNPEDIVRLNNAAFIVGTVLRLNPRQREMVVEQFRKSSKHLAQFDEANNAFEARIRGLRKHGDFGMQYYRERFLAGKSFEDARKVLAVEFPRARRLASISSMMRYEIQLIDDMRKEPQRELLERYRPQAVPNVWTIRERRNGQTALSHTSGRK